MSKLDILDEKETTHSLRLSYSRISKFASNGPRELNDETRTKLENKGTRYGKLVDILEADEDDFKEHYTVFDGEKPTAMAGQLADEIIDRREDYKENGLPTTAQVVDVARSLGLWKRVTNEDTFIGKFDTKVFWEYITAQLLAFKHNKELITMSDYLDAKETVAALKTHKHTSHIFDPQEEYIESYSQLELNFEYKNFKFLGFVDKVIIDHRNKTIRMIDLKTGSDPLYKFEGTFIKYKYYLQEAVYGKGVDYLKKKLGLEHYAVLPFQFVYIKRGVQTPIVYTVTPKWSKAALQGFVTEGGYTYEGLNPLLEDIAWHWQNKEFTYARRFVEGRGIVDLRDDFINLKQ